MKLDAILGKITLHEDRVDFEPGHQHSGRGSLSLMHAVVLCRNILQAYALAHGGIDTGISEREHERIDRALARVPARYSIWIKGALYIYEEAAGLKRRLLLRDLILTIGRRMQLQATDVLPVLLDVAASLVAEAMPKDEFLKNAALWYDSVTLDQKNLSTDVTTVDRGQA